MRLFIFNLVALFILGNLAMADTAYKKKDLYTYGQVKTYTGKDLQTIAFPIGGLGTGNINLGGRGDIRELEIFNRPNKGVHPDMTFFSIWIQEEGKEPVAKILERKLIPPYVGWMGFPRNQLAGVSRFDEVTFKGEYPLAFFRIRGSTDLCKRESRSLQSLCPPIAREKRHPCCRLQLENKKQSELQNKSLLGILHAQPHKDSR